MFSYLSVLWLSNGFNPSSLVCRTGGVHNRRMNSTDWPSLSFSHIR